MVSLKNKERVVNTQKPNMANEISARSVVVEKITTFLKNIFCLAIWVWLSSRIIGYPFPGAQYILPIVDAILTPLGWTLIKLLIPASIIAIVMLKAYWKVIKFLFFLWLRLLFFPFFIIYYLFLYPFRLISFSARAVNTILNNTLRTSVFKSTILLMVLFPSSVFISMNSTSLPWLVISIIASSISVLIVLRIAFLWTAKPVMFIEAIVTAGSKLLDMYVENISKESNAQVSKKKKNSQKDTLNEQLGWVYKGLDWALAFVERSTDQRIIVKTFLLLISIGFVISVSSFGVIFFTINKLHPGSFLNSSDWGLLSFIYSSLLVITTSGQITAETDLAKIAVISEILCGVSLEAISKIVLVL